MGKLYRENILTSQHNVYFYFPDILSAYYVVLPASTGVSGFKISGQHEHNRCCLWQHRKQMFQG